MSQSLEVESLAEWEAHRAHTADLTGWFVQSVDLSRSSASLAGVSAVGAVFLGCRFAPGDEERLRAAGALIFPELPGLPFDPYRGALYSAPELYSLGAAAEPSYAASLDARAYAWSGQPPDLAATLAASLHDHAIADALDETLAGVDPHRLVGVLGGHAMQRGAGEYLGAAMLGRGLTRAGRLVLTGGGPGAMEAANLGAFLAPFEDDALEQACALLAAQPSFRPSVGAWAGAAFAVRERWPVERAGRSIGIPTWFYGHEPPNAFATEIAKFFANALREDTLLRRCRGGLVYLGGAAGTVQEIFQAVTENYYAADPGDIAPLVLVGARYWSEQLPAWPLLTTLAQGRPMAESIHLVDSVEEALAVLTTPAPG